MTYVLLFLLHFLHPILSGFNSGNVIVESLSLPCGQGKFFAAPTSKCSAILARNFSDVRQDIQCTPDKQCLDLKKFSFIYYGHTVKVAVPPFEKAV